MVVSDGCIAEFDSPTRLLSDPSSLFHGLVNSWEKSHKNA
jgi:hypothetical protein